MKSSVMVTALAMVTAISLPQASHAAGALVDGIHFTAQDIPADGRMYGSAFKNGGPLEPGQLMTNPADSGKTWYIKRATVAWEDDDRSENKHISANLMYVPAGKSVAQAIAEKDWIVYTNVFEDGPQIREIDKTFAPDYFVINPGDSIELCVMSMGPGAKSTIFAAYLTYSLDP